MGKGEVLQYSFDRLVQLTKSRSQRTASCPPPRRDTAPLTQVLKLFGSPANHDPWTDFPLENPPRISTLRPRHSPHLRPIRWRENPGSRLSQTAPLPLPCPFDQRPQQFPQELPRSVAVNNMNNNFAPRHQSPLLPPLFPDPNRFAEQNSLPFPLRSPP